jgi:hypothetical protein
MQNKAKKAAALAKLMARAQEAEFAIKMRDLEEVAARDAMRSAAIKTEAIGAMAIRNARDQAKLFAARERAKQVQEELYKA